MFRGRFSGHAQYQPGDGEVALTWLSNWMTDHFNDLREDSTKSLVSVEPTHSEGCVTDLLFDIHLIVADWDTFVTLVEEIKAAIVDGGVVFASCDSGMGITEE